MITGSRKTLEEMTAASDGGRLVMLALGPNLTAEGWEKQDNYRGYRIRQYLWQGDGPVGRWFWQAQSDTELIGETHLYGGAGREAQSEIINDAMRAIDYMLDDPEWAEPVRNAMRADA